MNNKHFWELTISQKEFDCRLFTKLPGKILTHNLSSISFKLKRGILNLWQNKYPTLRTICLSISISSQNFSWELKYIPIAKYIISDTVALKG